MFGIPLVTLAVPIAVLFFIFLTCILYRVVVPTNSVHVVQRRKTSESYGRGQKRGNVYYKWPSFLPVVGVTCIELPTSIFGIDLQDYSAFDNGKVPFQVDIKAFFKVENAEEAAQRVESFTKLREQLSDILKGSVRTILASSDINTIMEERSVFGDNFTEEVSSQLKAWGVDTVKSIEFMDIRDVHGSSVIENIMAKKKSMIEKESRVEVATNKREAMEAEIEAQKQVDMRQQQADLAVGQATADKDKQVGIANERATQEIQEEAKKTAEKEMAVLQVQQERAAEIKKNVAVTTAEEGRATTVIAAEAEKKKAVITAEADKETMALLAEAGLIEQQKAAEGIEAVGTAKASAERQMLMAPVEAQITLAQEIGSNEGYMKYLINVKSLEVQEVVDTAKAEALVESDLKVIANSGDVDSGINNVMDILNSKGGTNIGAMLEGLTQTDSGRHVANALVERILPKE